MPMADRIEFDGHRRRHPPGDRRNGMVLQRDHGVLQKTDEEETANHLRSLFDRADMRRISIIRLPMSPPFRKYIQDRMKAFLADHNSYLGETHELRDFCHAVS